MDRTKKEAHQHGYVSTLFGRRIWLPEIGAKNPAMRAFAERAAINAPIQGGAADIIKRAMIRVPDALTAHKLKARLLLQVHDELLFEVEPGDLERTVEIVKPLMEKAAEPALTLSVKLQVDWGAGANWSAAH
jgi:DNA polymerase-1